MRQTNLLVFTIKTGLHYTSCLDAAYRAKPPRIPGLTSAGLTSVGKTGESLRWGGVRGGGEEAAAKKRNRHERTDN